MSMQLCIFQVLIVIGIAFTVLLYRLAVSGALYRAVQNLDGKTSAADFIALITGSLIQLVAILIMNKVAICMQNYFDNIISSIF